MGKLILNFCLLTTFCFCTTTLAANVGSIDRDGETASTHRTLQSKYNEGSGDLVLTSAAVLLQLVLHIVFKPTDSNSLKSEATLTPSTSTISIDSIFSDTSFTGFGLQSKQSGKCIDIYQGSSANGIKPAIWICNDQPNQKFSFEFQNKRTPETLSRHCILGSCFPIKLPGHGTFQIVAQVSGKCLELLDNSDVIQTDCLNSHDLSPDNPQLWFRQWWGNDLGNGWFTLTSAKNIGMCLTVYEGKVDNGQILNTYSCSQSNNQGWKFY